MKMAVSILTNTNASIAKRSSSKAQALTDVSAERLSTGKRVNHAKDDVAGLELISKFSAQIRASAQIKRDLNEAISIAQTADGYVGDLISITQRLRELAVYSANGVLSNGDRDLLQIESDQLIEAFNDLADTANFNGQKLLDGSFDKDFHGDDSFNHPINLQLGSLNSNDIGLTKTPEVAVEEPVVEEVVEEEPVVEETPTIDESGLVGSTGVVRVNLAWQADLDIDGVVVDPDGGALGYHAALYSSGPTTGIWDVDDLGGPAPNGENYYWESDAPEGQYAIYVRNYSNVWPDGDPITVTLTVKSADTLTQQDYTIPVSQRDIGPFYFDYPPEGSVADPVEDIVEDPELTDEETTTDLPEAQPVFDISTLDAAQESIEAADTGLDSLVETRATIGAVSNRLSSAINTAFNSLQAATGSRATIEDADMAREAAELARASVLKDSATAMLSQANAKPHWVISLLEDS